MDIYVGADHRGFSLKKKVVEYLKASGHRPIDAGTHVEGVDCDYPAISREVALAVAGSNGAARGILLCMTGIGHSIAANKVPGAFAALVYNTEAAILSRQHNDSNILVLGAKFTEARVIIEIIDVWLKTPFEGGRHQRRKDQILEIEKEFSREKGRQ